MKFDNYKTIKKTEWQELANQFGIKYEENSVVRYLVEKIAEKIGVDDKIVSDNELKKQVIEKINSEYEVVPVETAEAPKVEAPKAEKAKKATTKKSTTKKITKPKEPIIGKVKEPVVKEPIVEAPKLTRLEELRKECERYGVAWNEVHTEANLEQVLNGVKGAGVQPIDLQPSNQTSEQPTINTGESFEITSSNANAVAQAIENAPQQAFTSTQNPAFNPLAQLAQERPVNGGYTTSNAYLETYKNIYINAIRGHWRLLSINDINEMINRDNHTFTYQLNSNPTQPSKVEIILIQGKDSVRIPSEDKNEWLDING
jgi:hypothetical protein